jgi:hypothetical protein
LGSHDANVEHLVSSVQRQASVELSRQYLERHPHRSGWIIGDDEVAGRFISNENDEIGGPYDVVVDGRTLTWEEFGKSLEPYEGWRFRLVIEDHCVDLRPDAEVIELQNPDSK